MEYKVSKSVFFKEAILKVAYLWQEDFSIKITEDENNYKCYQDIDGCIGHLLMGIAEGNAWRKQAKIKGCNQMVSYGGGGHHEHYRGY